MFSSFKPRRDRTRFERTSIIVSVYPISWRYLKKKKEKGKKNILIFHRIEEEKKLNDMSRPASVSTSTVELYGKMYLVESKRGTCKRTKKWRKEKKGLPIAGFTLGACKRAKKYNTKNQ